MTDAEAAGRSVVLFALVVLLLICLLNAAIVISVVGKDELPSAAFRSMLTALLAISTYRGSVIGRLVLFAALFFGGGASVFSVVTNGVENLISIWMFVMGIVFLAVALCLLLVPQARMFLRYQRSQRSQRHWSNPERIGA